jgi:hypothetical protein
MWEINPVGAAGWKKTMQKLKEKLNSPMPREKKIKKIDLNPWNLHDVYAYQFHKEVSKENGLFGKYMLIQKIGEGRHGERNKLFMHVQVIDHVFENLPKLEDINRYRILPLDELKYENCDEKFGTIGIISLYKPSEYPAKHLTLLGATPGPSNKGSGWIETMSWFSMDYYLSTYYQFWLGREYETVEEGIYRPILS